MREAALYLAVLKMEDGQLAIAGLPGIAPADRFLRELRSLELLSKVLVCEVGELPADEPLRGIADRARALVQAIASYDAAIESALLAELRGVNGPSGGVA